MLKQVIVSVCRKTLPSLLLRVVVIIGSLLVPHWLSIVIIGYHDRQRLSKNLFIPQGIGDHHWLPLVFIGYHWFLIGYHRLSLIIIIVSVLLKTFPSPLERIGDHSGECVHLSDSFPFH